VWTPHVETGLHLRGCRPREAIGTPTYAGNGVAIIVAGNGAHAVCAQAATSRVSQQQRAGREEAVRSLRRRRSKRSDR
jgi:hypothetical protein